MNQHVCTARVYIVRNCFYSPGPRRNNMGFEIQDYMNNWILFLYNHEGNALIFFKISFGVAFLP